MPAGLDRRSLICAQLDPPAPGDPAKIPLVTGIDFIRVIDPADQTELEIYFIVNPDLIVFPFPPGTAFMADGSSLPDPFSGEVSATALDGSERLVAADSEFRQVVHNGQTRTVLYVRFEEPGGFALYRLHIDHQAIDPWFNDVVFSFKQGCPSGLDCEEENCCPPAGGRDVDIDYMARDFDSLNGALMDFAARYYPEWGERTTADMGVMITELFAALGDELSFIQDGFAREAFLETATQRRSVHRLARLVDYIPDSGRNAECLLALSMAPQGSFSAAHVLSVADRLRFWAVPEGRSAIPFELGHGLVDEGSLLAHALWNAMEIHRPDAGEPCLLRGATELFLAPFGGNNRLPTAGQVAGSGLSADQAWIGRRMILRSTPIDPSLPERSWPITITEVDRTAEDNVDLFQVSPPQGRRLTRIAWDRSEALPHAMRIEETVLLGNVAIATAGRTVTEEFRIGDAPAGSDPAVRAMMRATEREGPADEDCGPRPAAMLHGLRASETGGLNHLGAHDFLSYRVPDLILRQTGSDFAPAVGLPPWGFASSLLDADPDDRVFTVDPGMWRDVVHYWRSGETITHADLASADGFTLRFGTAEFGRMPEDGDLFAVTYRTLLGRRSNVAAHSIRRIAPITEDDQVSPAAAAQLALIAAVDNPLPAVLGTDPESMEKIRQNAPEFYKSFPLNAIRNEHFTEIVEREPWVQQAGARARWTGSWPTTFVTADPKSAFAYTDEQRTRLERLTDAVRMAGRDLCVQSPVYLPLDVQVSLCVENGHFEGHVREAVIEALAGGPCSTDTPFFHPNHFSFGDPLRRGMLEAAVQAVPGVRGVTGICLRKRGRLDWERFEEPLFRVAMNEILRVSNNPANPEHGSLSVHISETAEPSGCACCVP